MHSLIKKNVLFFEPAAEKSIGGLDLAISNFAEALKLSGINVIRYATREDLIKVDIKDTIIHFHGVWEVEHFNISRIGFDRGFKMIYSPHGMLEPWALKYKWWKKLPYFQLREKKHIKRCDIILATGIPEKEQLNKILPGSRVDIIPLFLKESGGENYLQARRHLGYKSDEYVLLFLSRIHKKKGLAVLIEAFSKSQRSSQKPRRLVIVGEGDKEYENHCKKLIEKVTPSLNSFNKIEWIGGIWNDAKWKYFQASDLFCLPTYSENFGLAVLEALSVGCPVIVGENTPWTKRSFLLTIKPTVDNLVHAIHKMEDASLSSREEISETIMTEFSMGKFTHSYLKIVQELLPQ